MKLTAENNKALLAEYWGLLWPPNQLNKAGRPTVQQRYCCFAKGTILLTNSSRDNHIFLSPHIRWTQGVYDMVEASPASTGEDPLASNSSRGVESEDPL